MDLRKKQIDSGDKCSTIAASCLRATTKILLKSIILGFRGRDKKRQPALLYLFFLLFTSVAWAIPIWEFDPMGITNLSLSKSDTAFVQYRITNNSTKTHTLYYDATAGITQISGSGLCDIPIVLPGNGSSCVLLLKVDGSQMAQSIVDGPAFCEGGSHHQCYRPHKEHVLSIALVEKQYQVGGVISGLSGTISLSDEVEQLTRSTNGHYKFSKPLEDAREYVVKIETQPAKQTCTVSNASGVIKGSEVNNIDVVCAANAYPVGGTVSGLSGRLTLLNNGADSKDIDKDGHYTFAHHVAEDSNYMVTLATQPSGQVCKVHRGSGVMRNAPVNDVDVFCVDATTLSVNPTGTIPVSQIGTTSTISVRNTGPNKAFNVHIDLPTQWKNVIQDDSDCKVLEPNDSCQLIFKSTEAYIAKGHIPVIGDNISTPPHLAIAFTVEDFLVWDVLDKTVQVVDMTSFPLIQWASNFTLFGSGAGSPTNGLKNTAALVTGGDSAYAALFCYQKTNGNAPIGTWYLPAICQLGSSPNCPSGFNNINTNLVRLGFGVPGFQRCWSSTETNPFDSFQYAWYEDFEIGANAMTFKKVPLLPLCVRSFTLE